MLVSTTIKGAHIEGYQASRRPYDYNYAAQRSYGSGTSQDSRSRDFDRYDDVYETIPEQQQQQQQQRQIRRFPMNRRDTFDENPPPPGFYSQPPPQQLFVGESKVDDVHYHYSPHSSDNEGEKDYAGNQHSRQQQPPPPPPLQQQQQQPVMPIYGNNYVYVTEPAEPPRPPPPQQQQTPAPPPPLPPQQQQQQPRSNLPVPTAVPVNLSPTPCRSLLKEKMSADCYFFHSSRGCRWH